MRLALVANPRSGTAPDPGRLAALLRVDGAQVSVTAITDLAREGNAVLDAAGMSAAAQKLSMRGVPDRIVVAGGDGSIGVTALLAAEMSVPLASYDALTIVDLVVARQERIELRVGGLLELQPEHVGGVVALQQHQVIAQPDVPDAHHLVRHGGRAVTTQRVAVRQRHRRQVLVECRKQRCRVSVVQRHAFGGSSRNRGAPSSMSTSSASARWGPTGFTLTGRY